MIEKCMTCKGKKEINGKPCPDCNGKGKIEIKTQLEKFIGTYRVKACYDLRTKDFIRLENGNLDKSFNDFYIQCANNVEIRDASNNELMVYVPTLKRGRNIVNKIYEVYGKDLISKIEETDAEVIFNFKTKDMDKIAKIVKPATSGAKIKPFSIKNLPRGSYTIPVKDMDDYNDLIAFIPKKKMMIKDREIIMPDGLIIKNMITGFDKIIQKSKGKDYNINAERKLCGLKGIEFINSLGEDMWNKFLDYLKTYVKQF